jgi:AcrR family transcriptional regulator
MPRDTEQNQRLKDERREQIVRAAVSIFARKGLALARISDIAAAADLSYGLVYHYFHDKEEIYRLILERAVQGGLRLSAEAAQRPGTPWERLRFLCEHLLAGYREQPDYFMIVLQALITEARPSAFHESLVRYGEQLLESITLLIREGQAAGQIVDIDARELALTLLAVIQGLDLSHALTATSSTATSLGVFPSVETLMRFLRP